MPFECDGNGRFVSEDDGEVLNATRQESNEAHGDVTMEMLPALWASEGPSSSASFSPALHHIHSPPPSLHPSLPPLPPAITHHRNRRMKGPSDDSVVREQSKRHQNTCEGTLRCRVVSASLAPGVG